MGYVAAISIVLIASLLAATATMFVQRFISIDFRRHHHDVGSVVFLQLGVVFAVLLAFVFSEAWGQYNEAAAAIDLEVGALHGVGMIAATLPAGQGAPILKAEKAYLESIVTSEWRVLADRRTEDIGTDDKLRTLIAEAANLRTDSEQSIKKTEILSLLSQAHAQRETRIFQAGSGIPGMLWGVLIAFTVVLTLFVALSEIQYRPTATAITVCFAAGICSILVVARLLDYPFEGALALAPTDFITVTHKISKLIAS